MIITNQEGHQLAAKFLQGFCSGFQENNHVETMAGLFAPKMSWKWSDGTKGEGSPHELFDIFKSGWAAACSFSTYTNERICVDTDNGRIVVSFQCVGNMDGRLGMTNIIVNNLAFILLLDPKTKKVARWSAIWDNNHQPTLDAFAKIVQKASIEMPQVKKPSMPITLEEGEDVATKYLELSAAGFKKNNHAELFRSLCADYCSWDWSDGTKGEGTYEEFFDLVAKTWGATAESWLPTNPMITVDTNNSVVLITFTVVINLTGGFSDENNPVMNDMAVALHLNEDHKITKWNLCWDNNNVELKAAVARVASRLEESNKATGIGMNTPMGGVLTGQ